MVVRADAFGDENGPPRELHVKRKPLTSQATEVLVEVHGRRDYNGLEPMPHSTFIDLKKPRDFAISLLQPQDTLGSLPSSTGRKRLLTLADELNQKSTTLTPQEDVQPAPAWLSRPFDISGQLQLPELRGLESTHGEKAEEGKQELKNYLPSKFEPSYLGHASGRTVYCYSKLAQGRLVPAANWNLNRDNSSEEESVSDDDFEDEPRTLYVANPDPEPDPISAFFSKSAAYNVSLAQQWAGGYLDRARCDYLEDYVHSPKKVNRHAPWMPSLFNPVREDAPTKAWSMLGAPFVTRFKDSCWTMKTPLGQGSRTRASRLLCDNDDNDMGHCVACKYESLYKFVLSTPFRRYRAARGAHYSYNSCRACFGQLDLDDAYAVSDDYVSPCDPQFYEDPIPPRPSVDADKLWAGPLIQGVDLDVLKELDDDDDDSGEDRLKKAAKEDLASNDRGSFPPPASPVDVESDSDSTDDGNVHALHVPEQGGESDQDDSDGGGEHLPPSLRRNKKRRRRHSSPEPFVAPSSWIGANAIPDVHQEKGPATMKRESSANPGENASNSPGEVPRKQDVSFILNDDESPSTSRAQKRARKLSLPSSSASAEAKSSTEPRKTALQVVLDSLPSKYRQVRYSSGVYHCPFEGCTQQATHQGDLVRHLGSKKHATHTYVCLDGGCLQQFAREDPLRWHHSNNRGKAHKLEHGKSMRSGYSERVPKDEVEEIRRMVKAKFD